MEVLNKEQKVEINLNDYEEYRVHIQKRNNETNTQFEFRRRLYDKIFNDIKNEEKAVIYSNIWINILSMDCTYPKDVMEMIEKYRPSDEDNVFK
jgi:hypothetical protein